ncbi:TfoX/Sxy family protein [Pelagibius marinus]|uniref:TfoX/Sxy family protein n=1 Tax=Pelagibius marinus TaxID=2762760 RepID=UPI0029C9B711|nr:TfoX/Sxy family protein [Pelagibius marinus]
MSAPAQKTAGAIPPFIARCLTLLLPLGPAAPRRMFGGWGFFLDGVMIALVAGERLYFKTDSQTAARFAAAGAEPFVYHRQGAPVTLSYWSAPAASLEDPPALLAWAELALGAARRSAAQKATRKRRRRDRPQ